jgi:NhaP-type Na+/H+ or K+/H+ antiporter
MLFSIALILLSGFLIGIVLEKIKIPKLVGFIIIGLIIGPYALNLIDSKLLSISSELRQIALIIILTRAGLSLDISSLKKIGRPAILMSFIPASFEIVGTTIFGPIFLGISTFEALLLGSVLGAVSPAVVVPRMIKLQKDGYGRKHNIPELLLAGSSVDDVYVIVLFYAFLGLVENNVFNLTTITMIPVSIILGILLGVIVGFILSFTFKKTHFNLTIKILLTLSSSFLMIAFENLIKDYLSISSLLGIMTLGLILLSKNRQDAIELEEGYHKLWIFFEIFLFVLVGASVDINYALSSGINTVLLLLTALSFRMFGVFICLIKTKINFKEKIFIAIAYLPKATVQASIGGIALSMGLACGSMVLTIAVLSILITAPIGAILIDNTFKRLLTKDIIL